MKVCPNCHRVIGFNSYFGAYICDECGWEDDSYNKQRLFFENLSEEQKNFLESILATTETIQKPQPV